MRAVDSIRHTLKDGKERAAWEGFMANYVAFHYYTARYRLRELTDSAYANPELENDTYCGGQDSM